VKVIAKKVPMKSCACCGEEKQLSEFYKSQSPMFKYDQKCPICKQCLQDIYDENFQYYKDMEKALYKTLFSLDYYFDLKLCKRSLIDVYNTDKSILRAYMSSINLIQYKGKTAKDSPPFNIFDVPDEDFEKYELEDLELPEPILISKEMLQRWGVGRPNEDYLFLQDKYETMCNTYDDRNPSSIWTYEQIALNFLDIKKEREKNNPNFTKIKTLQETNSKLMGDCKMKIAQIDNSEDESICFGTFIKQIEDYEPILTNERFSDYDKIYESWKDDFRDPFAQAMKLDVKSLKRKKNKKGDK
jgi:hypothetical protein